MVLLTVTSKNKHSLILVLLLVIMIFSWEVSAGTVNVALGSYLINEVTYYEWNITGLTNGNTSPIILQFPDHVVFNSPVNTTLTDSVGNILNGTLSIASPNITINSPPSINNTAFTFRFTNIKNPYYYNTFTVRAFQGATELSSAYITYEKGPIQNCKISFAGVTGQLSSNATVDFVTTNPISSGQVTFDVFYGGTYNESTNQIIDNRESLTCRVTINNGTPSSTISATISNLNQPPFACTFINVSLPANSSVSLFLNNVRNPPYKSNYFLNDFYVTTRDASLNYDSATKCVPNDVIVDSYAGTFNLATQLVNTNYVSPIFSTVGNITKNFNSYDSLVVVQDTLEMNGSSNINIRRIVSGNSFNYIYISGGGLVNLNFGATSSVNTETDRMQLSFLNYNLRSPPSTSAVTIYFRFFKKGLEFMQIYVPISALASQIASTNILITPSTKEIGSETTYTISLNLTQPLSSSSFILIDFPIEIGLSNFTSGSLCELNSSAIPVNCFVSDSVNKIIRINISGAVPIGNILLRLGNIINPDNPEKNYNIIVETYNNQSDSSSKVEFAPTITLNYTFRAINIATNNTIYTVNHQPSTLVITYTPGVRIPSGSLLTFDFLASISQPVYKSASINSAAVTLSPSQNNNTINLTTSTQILSNSNVTIIFEFKAPSAMGNYSAVNLIVSSNSIQYETSGTPLKIEVGFPASEVFTIVPSSLITGTVNSYTFSFYTNVAHPETFYLLIFFPADTKFSASTTCSPAAVCENTPSDQSNGTQKVLSITMKKSQLSNSYSLILSSITNSRKTGATLPFLFQTKTSISGSIIIVGTATATISLPNTATVNFDKTKSYYRGNTEPVSFSCVFFNKLEGTDYITAEFDYRTYSQNNNTTLSCPTAACSILSSSGFTTTVKIVPTSTIEPLSVWIEGLVSSTTTLVTDSYEISIRSYSESGQLMDLGKLKYNLSCISPAALLSKNCRTCSESIQICETCYNPGYYLFNGTCVTNCGNSSMYQAYPGDNSTCRACQSPCSTCISETQCLTCILGYFMYDNGTCKDSCIQTGQGLYIYNVTGMQLRCRNCWSSACITCNDGGSSSCTDCGTAFQQSGRCETSCDLNSNYIKNGTSECLPCNNRCFGCTGGGIGDCIACKGGFFNISGLCETSCPNGTVSVGNNNCGCEGECSLCELLSTRCIACKNTSLLLYNYQCVEQCPSNSYPTSSKSCTDCAQGCLSCTQNACLQCLPSYNVYENKCFSECNTIGERFSAVGGVCIECSVGCDVCDATLSCSVCLGGYTLVNQSCKLTCEVMGNCEPANLVPDKIMPIPGFITTGVWLITLGVLKIFFLPSLYMPYSYIFIGSVIEFVLIIASLAKMNTQIQVSLAAVSRLLAISTGPSQYMYSVLGLLASSVALNYISNIVFLVLFWKYLKKYIGDRQIDKISNYLVLTVGALTNYRFSLVAYSKMFPKPNILVENQSKLTPIHYMCISSLFAAILPLSAAGILVYNEYPLTDLFMLGIDLLIIVVLEFIFTIWMVSVDKKEEYFQGVRKYQKEEFNKTLEGLNEKEDFQNNSNAKLAMHISNISQTIEPQEIDFEESPNKKSAHFKSDNENDPLPMIPNRKNQLNLQTIKVKPKGHGSNDDGFESESISAEGRAENLEDQRTIRNSKNKTEIKKKGDKQDEMVSRQREVPKNFGKEKKVGKTNQNKTDLNIKINRIEATSKIQRPVESDEFSEEHDESQDVSVKQTNSEMMAKERKQMKPQTQRSSGILPATMMSKKESFGLFDSEKATSQIDEIDFESLIQTRMIDRSQNQNKNKTKSVTNEDPKYEEVSPSWFNEQNQRFDYDDSSDA